MVYIYNKNMDKSMHEINWWRDFYKKNRDRFYGIRLDDFIRTSRFFPEIKDEVGTGLDYGCGLLSMLEFSEKEFDAIDPLVDSYREMLELGDNYSLDTNKKYDWVWCINVLDHTETPEILIKDIKKKLKKGGRLYLEVNFDDSLGACHYELYNKDKVNGLVNLKKEYEHEFRNEPDKQTLYYAKYIKV